MGGKTGRMGTFQPKKKTGTTWVWPITGLGGKKQKKKERAREK